LSGRVSLKQAIAYVRDDELVEITTMVRMQERFLDPHERKRAARQQQAT
jgi:GTP-binding protein